jgi:hypothetical protein
MMQDDLVLSWSVSRRGSNIFREDDNGANNSWDSYDD